MGALASPHLLIFCLHLLDVTYAHPPQVSYVNKKYIAQKMKDPKWPLASNWEVGSATGLDTEGTLAVEGWSDINTFNEKRAKCCDNPRG
jgi:hypothetical protein